MRFLARNKSQILKILIMSVLAGVVLFSFVGLARELVVTSTADSGTGTLRWALQSARSGDTITFDPKVFPPGSPVTIYPRSELPPIERPRSRIKIDASNAGVVIDGDNVPGNWNNGLQIYTDDCVVMGLWIRNFTGSGITACGASRTNIGGSRGVGASPIGQGNLLSSNGIGIDLCSGGSDNVIVGNIIGTDVRMQENLGNDMFGISIEDGISRTTVGPNNMIAFNSVGIDIQGPRALQNTITQNVFVRDDHNNIVLRGGANADLAAPFLATVDPIAGTVEGSGCADCTIEIYSFSKSGMSAFEGLAIADASGLFFFDKGTSLHGETVIATATDSTGNTSPQADRLTALVSLQEHSLSMPRQYETATSSELSDNRIAVFTCALLHPEYEPEVFPDLEALDSTYIFELGVTRVRVSINNLDPPKIDWDTSEFVIEPRHDAFISGLVDNAITVTFNLTFWDKDYVSAGGSVSYPRFQTEQEIQRYLDYVQFIVRHFRGRVDYYELWNEPTNRDSIMLIEVDTYIELARRAVSVIREEDAGAKIIMGAVAFLAHRDVQEYLFEILRSKDLLPLVDVISWHPMYGTSPAYDYHREYYYDYASLVREIKHVATAHGFDGEFVGDELNWLTPDQSSPYQEWPNRYSEIQCSKYFARGIVTNLGLLDFTSVILLNRKPLIYDTVQNLCTALSGNESIDMLVEVDIETDSPVAHCAFRYPNGDRMLAIWTDGVAQNEDSSAPATITLLGLTAGTVTGIDVLHGFEQELVFEVNGEDTIVRDLLVKDYPILIRLSDVTFGPGYVETVGDGFHRLGDVNAMPSSTGSGSDRDGDGVPDDEDYCPDWPGSKEANGC